MSARSGTTGEVEHDGVITGMKSWTLEYSVAMLDSTDFASQGVSEFIAGVTEWHGTFEGYKDVAPKQLSTATATLTLQETSSGGMQFIGPAFITNVRASTDHDGIVSYSYDFQGSGALATYPTS